MKLILTSNGINLEIVKEIESLTNKKIGDLRILYIPDAIFPEKEDASWLVDDLYNFSSLGVDIIWYSLLNKETAKITRDFENTDIVWFGGGNTFYLLNLIKEKDIFNLIQKMVLEDKVIYAGTSAGSLIASSHITSTTWKEQGDSNDVGITDLSGFNFIPEIIFAHYKKDLHKTAIEHQRGTTPVYALSDNSALLINNLEIKILGDIEHFN